MPKTVRLIISILVLVGVTNAASAPFITKCKSSDTKCAKESATKVLPLFASGLPDLGVEVLDPVHFDKVDSSSPSLKFIMTDVTLTGLKGCEVKKVERDVANSKINLQFLCTASLDGQYELNGNILVLAVAGTGKVHVTLRKAEINVEMDIVDKTGSDGKKHWHIKRFHHSFDLKDKPDVVFENLFKGNKVLRQAAMELFESSGPEVVHEIGAPMIKETVTRVMKNVNHMFAAVPAEELAID